MANVVFFIRVAQSIHASIILDKEVKHGYAMVFPQDATSIQNLLKLFIMIYKTI